VASQADILSLAASILGKPAITSITDNSNVARVFLVEYDMLRRARELGEDYLALGDRNLATFLTEMSALNWLPPDHLPRATQHVPQMVAMIERLVAGGHAYVADGHVYFGIASWPSYGELSGLSREQMLPLALERGSRPEMPGRRDPLGETLDAAGPPIAAE